MIRVSCLRDIAPERRRAQPSVGDQVLARSPWRERTRARPDLVPWPHRPIAHWRSSPAPRTEPGVSLRDSCRIGIAQVVVAYLRRQREAEATVDEILAAGGTAVTLRATLRTSSMSSACSTRR